MDKTILLIALISLVAPLIILGQNDETLFGGEGLRLSGIWGSFNRGYTSFSDDFSRTKALFFDFEFNRVVTIGIGSVKTKDKFGPGEGYAVNFGSALITFTPQSHKPFHPRFGFLMGNGKLKSDQFNDKIYVFQPSAGIEINVFKWFRFGLEGGYRFISGSETANFSDDELSSYFINLNFRFGFSKVQ